MTDSTDMLVPARDRPGRRGEESMRSSYDIGCVVLRVVVVTAFVCLAGPGIAGATPTGGPILVFESHTGPRTRESARLLSPLREELEAHGFAARPATILKIAAGRGPRPGVLDEGMTAAEIGQRVANGYDEFSQGKFKEAVGTLTEAIQLIRRNPALLALDTTNSNTVFNAYVCLALSLSKLEQAPESVATMTELIRMFRSQPISRARYGPIAEQFYRSVNKQVLAMGRGRLEIAAGNPNAMIFVDGQIRGMGTASIADLIPGLYRVFIQVPGDSGRQYEIEVRANDDSALDVEWDLDSSLWIAEPWVGFQFGSDAERRREASYASGLARRWIGVLARTVVIGTMRMDGKSAIIGTLYDTDGKVLQSAVVTAEGDVAAKARALAQFLADGTPAEGVTVLASAHEPQKSAAARSPRRGRLLVYGGVAMVAVGVGLYLYDEDAGSQLPVSKTYRDTAPLGVAVGAVGLAAVAVGVWWSLRASRSSSAPTFSAGRSQATIGWSGRF